ENSMGASHPSLKSVDWISDIYLTLLHSVSAEDAITAIDTIVVGAIGSFDASHEAVKAAFGRVVASVRTSKPTGAYDAFAKVALGTAPNNLFSTVGPLAANEAAKALCEFKGADGVDHASTAQLLSSAAEYMR
ncbi:unnamed protein product, partial [Prorocentrum cordatum]